MLIPLSGRTTFGPRRESCVCVPGAILEFRPASSMPTGPPVSSVHARSPMPHKADARYWRERAQETYAQANDEADQGSKQMMLTIARGYEVLAGRSEQLASELQREILPRL